MNNNISPQVADRRQLFSELEHFIADHRSSKKKLALLLININHFRQINIVYGHQAGDQVLVEFVRRLDDACRDQDFIARMGNSEFVVVLPEIINEGHATLAAHKLLNAVDELFQLDDKRHRVTANMGVALFPDHGHDVLSLVQKAEIALLESRNSSQLYNIYTERPSGNSFNSWAIEVDLQNADEQDEFELFFQPQVCLKSGCIFGAEALIRWNNHDKGYVRPDLFIPVAEKSGQIHDITWWTINAALRMMQEWPTFQRQLAVAVNISPRILRDPGFVESVRSSLNIWGVDPQYLILEITESALMEDTSVSFAALEELKSIGLGISIDDFGTGYSSMSYFKYIPANELKVDQSFVFNMMENRMDQHIVKTIVEMAHGFDLKVVAEGIENKETLQALREFGCDAAQGYHLARPMPQSAFIDWLNSYAGVCNLIEDCD